MKKIQWKWFGWKLAISLLLGIGTAQAANSPTPTLPLHSKRPLNFLLILVDDLGKEGISCYGAEDIRTPNIDRLAATGIRFENAYSMPQCTPTRVTLLTGQYPYHNGWVNHWDVPRWGIAYFDWSIRRNMTWARLLRQAGYRTAAAGKWQINDFRLTPDAMRRHGFEAWCMWTGYETGNPPSGQRYWDPYIHTQQGSRTYSGQFGPDIFCNFLLQFMEQHRNEPMALYYPMVLTHGPLTTTPDAPNARSALEKHKAMVRYMDKLVGRLLDKLEELGLRDHTVVIFTTDNGTSGRIIGHRNGHAVRGGKAKLTEPGCCAPFLVSCPGVIPQGVVTDALTDFTDLFPTFCDLAGVPIPKDLHLDGHSLAPLLLGQSHDTDRTWILSMGHGPARVDARGVRGVYDFNPRVLRDKRYKVWVNQQRQIDRLYDLQVDPWEQQNLIDRSDPSLQAVLTKFRKIVASMPPVDARPAYHPRLPNPWDRWPRRSKRQSPSSS